MLLPSLAGKQSRSARRGPPVMAFCLRVGILPKRTTLAIQLVICCFEEPKYTFLHWPMSQEFMIT